MSGLFVVIEGPNGVGKTTTATLFAARLRERLTARGALSRLELTGMPGREPMLYQEARAFLRRHDWDQDTISCHGKDPEHVVAATLGRFDKYTKQAQGA